MSVQVMHDPAPVREIRVEADSEHYARITAAEDRTTFMIVVRGGLSVTSFCASREDMQLLLKALKEML